MLDPTSLESVHFYLKTSQERRRDDVGEEE